MEEDERPFHPVIDEDKGKPILRIPVVDQPDPKHIVTLAVVSEEQNESHCEAA